MFVFVRFFVATVGSSRFFAYGDRWSSSVTRGLAVVHEEEEIVFLFFHLFCSCDSIKDMHNALC